MNNDLLKKYASLAVNTGVNIQKDNLPIGLFSTDDSQILHIFHVDQGNCRLYEL